MYLCTTGDPNLIIRRIKLSYESAFLMIYKKENVKFILKDDSKLIRIGSTGKVKPFSYRTADYFNCQKIINQFIHNYK